METQLVDYLILSKPRDREQSKTLWTQADETLGMFDSGKMPDTSSVTNNYTNSNNQEIIKVLRQQNSLLREQSSYLIQLIAKSTSFTAKINGQVLMDFGEGEQAINGRM